MQTFLNEINRDETEYKTNFRPSLIDEFLSSLIDDKLEKALKS